MKKSFLILVLCLSLVVGMCACAAAESDKVTFNLRIRVRPLHGDPDEMEFFKRLEEETGVHIIWDKIQQAEYEEKNSLLLGAGNNLPDGFFGKYSLSAGDLVTYGSQGYFIPLNDLIEEYAPNLSKLFAEHPEFKAQATAPDGNIYAMPYTQQGEDGTIASNMMINVTWLERLGLEKPTTLEELEEVLTAFKEQDANGNGDPNDEIPMTFKFNGSQRDIGGLFGAFGYADTLTDDSQHLIVDNGKVIFVPTTEGYKEGCAYLYEHFFSQGLIDLEGFTMDKKTYNAQNQGEVANIGMFMCWNAFDLGTVHQDEYEPISPFLGPNGTTSWGWTTSNSMMPTGFTVTKECKDPAALVAWADTIYDPYWSMQCDLGPVGINLIDNGDGTYSYADVPEGMSYDEFRYKEAFASDGPIALFSELYDSGVIERSAGHQAKFDRNENYYRKYATTQYLPTMLMSEEDNDKLALIQTNILEYTNDMRAKWLAKGGVEDEWDEYVERLNSMGLEEFVEIYQNAYTAAYGE